MQARNPSLTDSQVIRLDIPRSSEWASLLRLTVAGLVLPYDLSTESIDDLRLIVTEAYGHAVVSAQGADRIRCTFDVGPTLIRIWIEADARCAPAAADDADVNLFMLRALVDEVSLRPGAAYHLALSKTLC